MTRPIRIALIGLGNVGRSFLGLMAAKSDLLGRAGPGAGVDRRGRLFRRHHG